MAVVEKESKGASRMGVGLSRKSFTRIAVDISGGILPAKLRNISAAASSSGDLGLLTRSVYRRAVCLNMSNLPQPESALYNVA